MPEVCEVLLTSQYLSKLIGYSLIEVTPVNGRYMKNSIKGLNKIKFPLTVKNIQTKGKFMWFTFKHHDEIYYLLCTFGLTGRWSFEELDQTRVLFTFKKNTKEKIVKVYYDDMRNFGTLEFTNDVKILDKKLNSLGDDLLQSKYSHNDIKQRLDAIENHNKKIVVVLMDQTKKNGIGCGLGNYLVPEILYTSKISPRRTIGSLTEYDIKNLTNAIKSTLYIYYNNNTTQYIDHLRKFLKKHAKYIKDGKYPSFHSSHKNNYVDEEFKVYGRIKDDIGNNVTADKIIPGRTTYWVPNIQK